MTLLLLFAGAPQGGQGTPEPPVVVSGQPTMIRTQQITFGPGSRDRSGGWNFRLLDLWLDKARRVFAFRWKVRLYGNGLAAAQGR